MRSVVAPTRLHFGLMHVPVEGLTHWPDGTPVRKFGGVGLMIDRPAVAVSLTPSKEWSAAGSLAERAIRFARRIVDTSPYRRGGLELVADGPPEHVGLGVGTALGLAVAKAITMDDLFREWPAPELARVAGRGGRSGIGLHGFDRGGFLLDGGKLADTDTPELLARIDFPAAWRVVLFRPKVPATWHGERERRAFARPRPVGQAAATTTWLARLAIDALEPSVRAADFESFAESVSAYNRRAGEPFAADQGGAYAGPAVTGLIETLRGWGVTGVGQSSWGPTVFAFAPDPDAAVALADRGRHEIHGLADVTVAAGNNRGALTLFTK